MKTNTDLPLRLLPTAEVMRRLENVQDMLTIKSFGYYDEACYKLMEERHLLFQELKRRKGA
jgi:hypothetical protein